MLLENHTEFCAMLYAYDLTKSFESYLKYCSIWLAYCISPVVEKVDGLKY